MIIKMIALSNAHIDDSYIPYEPFFVKQPIKVGPNTAIHHAKCHFITLCLYLSTR